LLPGACEAGSQGFQKIESIKVGKIPDLTSVAADPPLLLMPAKSANADKNPHFVGDSPNAYC